MVVPGLFFFVCGRGGRGCVNCVLSRKGSCIPGRLIAGLRAAATRDIFDFLRAERPWWGRLSETGFLGQLYDLDALPSTDPRHATAAEDITRHCMANFDWGRERATRSASVPRGSDCRGSRWSE
jgi:hypothetical protein